MTILRTVVAGAICLVLASSAAAREPFYTSLLQRGVAEARGGRFEAAVEPLRIAAFGLLDDPRLYETAQVYLAVVNEKLGRNPAARLAASKAAEAERVAPSFLQLDIDAATRAEFIRFVSRTLPPETLAAVPGFSGKAPEAPPAAPAPAAPAPETSVSAAADHPEPHAVPSTASAPPAATPPAPVVTTGRQSADEVSQLRVPRPIQKEAAAPAPADESNRPAAAKPEVPRPTPITTVPPPSPAAAPAAPRSVVSDPTRTGEVADTTVNPLVAAARRSRSNSVEAQTIDARLAAAARLLEEGRMPAAREEYLSISLNTALTRTQMLATARGLTLLSAWRDSATLYSRTLPFRPGEELHMFSAAVDNFELGYPAAARKLLAAALPSLALTPEVQGYRTKIEQAR